jgi:hypothetical protein
VFGKCHGIVEGAHRMTQQILDAAHGLRLGLARHRSGMVVAMLADDRAQFAQPVLHPDPHILGHFAKHAFSPDRFDHLTAVGYTLKEAALACTRLISFLECADAIRILAAGPRQMRHALRGS